MFLNTFLRLDNSQALDMLYEKLSNKFKNLLVIVKKAKNLNEMIVLLCNIDANIKKISK